MHPFCGETSQIIPRSSLQADAHAQKRPKITLRRVKAVRGRSNHISNGFRIQSCCPEPPGAGVGGSEGASRCRRPARTAGAVVATCCRPARAGPTRLSGEAAVGEGGRCPTALPSAALRAEQIGRSSGRRRRRACSCGGGVERRRHRCASTRQRSSSSCCGGSRGNSPLQRASHARAGAWHAHCIRHGAHGAQRALPCMEAATGGQVRRVVGTAVAPHFASGT